jgi:translocation and assembly module TamB
MRRAFYWSVGVLLGLAVSTVLVLTVLLASPAASHWLIVRAGAYAPGALTIEHIEGSVLAGLTATGIDYRQDQMQLRIARLELAMDPLDLLRGRIGLRRLAIEDVVCRAPATSAEPAPFTPPARIVLPVSLDIDQFSVRRLTLHIGTRETAIDALELSAHAGPVAGLRVTRFRVVAAGVTAKLHGRAALHSPYSFTAEVDWHGRVPDKVQAAGHATLKGDLHGLRLDHRLSAPFVITTRGAVRFEADEPSVALEGEWDGLRWPLQGAAEYRSARGRYSLTGTPGNYRYTLAGDFQGEQVPPLEVQARGTGNADGLVVEHLAVAALGGKLVASGTLDWEAGLAVDLGIDAQGVNPGLLLPDWPGNLGLQTRLTVEVRDKTYHVRLQDARLEGTLRARPVEALGDVTLRAGGVEIDHLLIRSGENRLRLKGRLGEQLNVEFSVDAPTLALLAPDLAGSIKGEGSLHGDVAHPGGRIEWFGAGLRYQENAVGSLRGQVVLDGQDPQRSTARLTASDLSLDGRALAHLTLEARGWLARQRLQADVSTQAGSAVVSLQGGYAGGRWSGRLERADFDLKALGDWRLREPVRLAVSARRLEPVAACWVAQPAGFCLQGAWEADGRWRASARLDQLALGPLGGLFDLPGRIEGALDVEAEASGSKGRTEARVHARSAQGMLEINSGEGPPYTSSYRDAVVNARYGDKVASADFSVSLAEGQAQGRIEVRQRGQALEEYPLGGELNVTAPDITFVNVFSTELNATAGSAAAKLRLGGSVGAPRVSGYAELVQGKLRIPELGLELADIGLRAQGNGTQHVALSGAARSDKGVVSLQGDLRLDPKAHWPFNLEIEGREFGIARLPEANVTADPTLQVSGDTRRVEVKGRVAIPTAKITIRQLPEDAVRVSDDQVIVGSTGAAPQAQRAEAVTALVLDVDLKVGKAVHFEGMGLATDLTGHLRLRSLAGGDIVGNGVLNLKNGTYEGYGQELVITQGRLLFAGPLDNPALDIRATRTAGNVVAGIQITGTLRSPLAEVYSDPVMPQAEAMSYLLTGKPLSSGGSTESQAIAAAAGLGASNPLTKEITGALGVEVGVESGATEEESMVSVGKQLTSQLHVDYLYGLFNEAWKMKFTYELSRYFSLTGESGLEQAIDLNVTIDR